MIDTLTSYGDLLEFREESGSGAESVSLLHLLPPSFVRRQSGMVFLLGIAPDRATPLPDAILRRVEYVAHTRRVKPQDGENLSGLLEGQGFIELPESLWLRAPRPTEPRNLVDEWTFLLEKAATSGEVAGLTICDPERSPDFYKGRWVEPGKLTGRFVSRREQRYGADLWSYVQLETGQPVRLLDFRSREWRACDHAWHLQMAMDGLRGNPQRYRIDRGDTAEATVLTFFSPLPGWARRRLDILGELVAPRHGLFAYRLPVNELAEERRFLETRLWLATEGSGQPPGTGR